MADRALPTPFTWCDGHLAASLPGAQVRFTTRRGGVSTGPYASLNLATNTEDAPESLTANSLRLAELVGLPASRVARGRQVHGGAVRVVCEPVARLDAEPAADGQATALGGVAVAVGVADCLPVALAGDGGVAMLHAGWRGLAAGVLEAGADALRELGVAGPLVAAIGPGAGPCCYETGEEVHAALDVAQARVGERHLDLKLVARTRLQRAGVDSILDVGLCTMCARDDGDESLFFSHRRDEGVTGRQVGIAWRA